MEGKMPECNYEINNHEYTKGYYHPYGIYLLWSTFLKTISIPKNLLFRESKNVIGKMWSGHSVSSKLVGLFFFIQQKHVS
jgi:hypothetical protein